MISLMAVRGQKRLSVVVSLNKRNVWIYSYCITHTPLWWQRDYPYTLSLSFFGSLTTCLKGTIKWCQYLDQYPGMSQFSLQQMKSIIQILLGRALTTLPEAPLHTVSLLLLLGDSWCMSLLPDIPTCAPHFPCLSNVLLIYTCWAQGCIGICCTLTASITQQALLLPFKIHLKRFAGATVRPGMDAMILMCYCEECFAAAAWSGTAGHLCALFMCL